MKAEAMYDLRDIENPDIIGRGTWYDKAAAELIEREKKLGRSLKIRTESGLGASGFPHIGSLGDALRNYALALAVRVQGYDGEFIAFSDDKDGLRKVPAGLPEDLEKWLGYPVTGIPDPFGDCHASYGNHMTSLLLEALDITGVDYKFVSGNEVYKQGLLNQEIVTILRNHEKVGEIIQEEIGQEKFQETLPYFPICEKCGSIYATNAHTFVPEENKILYRCEGLEVRGNWIEGCRYEGEVDVTSGEGKLAWKVEFAARWKALDIRFEAYGKDIADSVRVNDRICREVLYWEPPMHVQYEMFLDRGGKKISKSAGNVFTPQVWYRYGSPQSLDLLIYKRFVGTKSGSVEDIPVHMDELDDLEEIYFGKKKIANEVEKHKLTGLYEYSWLMKPPKKPSIHIPYNLMVKLARVAPKGVETQFIARKLEEYNFLNDTDVGLSERIQYALNWVNDFEEEESRKIELTQEETEIVKAIIQELGSASDEAGFQASVFNVSKTIGIKARKIFPLLYQILIGRKQGPRFGPYVKLVGKDSVIKDLESALKNY